MQGYARAARLRLCVPGPGTSFRMKLVLCCGNGPCWYAPQEELMAKVARFFTSIAVLVVLSSGDRTSGQGDKAWIVGQIAPLTGPAATVGTRVDQSTQMWVDEVNSAGGIRGRKVQLINCNDENRPERAVARARDMIVKGAVIILGNALTASIRAVQPLTRQGPIFIIASPNVVPSPDSFSFQVSPT